MRRPMTKLALTSTIALTVMLAACDKEEKHSGPIAATVNGAPIYEESVAAPLKGVPAQLLNQHKGELRQQVLEQLIQRELVQQEGKKLNVAKDPEFKKQLKDMKSQLVNNFVIKAKLEKDLTEDKVRAAYEANKEAQAYPAVKASHILLKTEQEAKDLLQVVTPENFAQMAKDKSVGPSAPKGGELGWFRKEAMIPAFADLAFATKPGTIASKPVKTQFGWHVIYVEGKDDKHIPAYDEVKENIRAQLGQQLVQNYMKSLRESADVKIMDTKPAQKPAVEGQQDAPAQK